MTTPKKENEKKISRKKAKYKNERCYRNVIETKFQYLKHQQFDDLDQRCGEQQQQQQPTKLERNRCRARAIGRCVQPSYKLHEFRNS